MRVCDTIEVFLIYFILRCQGYDEVPTIVVNHFIVDHCGKNSRNIHLNKEI